MIGHPYYHNSSTKESTYTRPGQTSAADIFSSGNSSVSGPFYPNGISHGVAEDRYAQQQHPFKNFGKQTDRSARNGYHGRHRDRPKTKRTIPGCEPWILVQTRLGRRFVHNPEQGQSYWKFPQDVLLGVIELDREERDTKAQSASKDEDPQALDSEAVQGNSNAQNDNETTKPLVDSEGEEYEEVEVTDDGDEENPSKRLRPDNEDNQQDKPVDFDEDDIAFQLAAMGDDYGLDPGEYGGDDMDVEEGAEGLPLTEEDSSALFKDLLEDFQISPYNTWERLIEEGYIVEDDRYTALPNMRSRREVWSEWSREKIQMLKEQRAMEEKKDPRISYFAFLEAKATPKLYWPEFRRKYQKEPEMRNSKLLDKNKEKWYREHVNRLKLPETTLKNDLVSLLKSVPLHLLNRSSTFDTLPVSILTDLRFISLRSTVKRSMIEAHIENLPNAPSDSNLSPEEEAQKAKAKADRVRRERALAERQSAVEDEKRKQQGALRQSKGKLREGEEEIERAMRIGRDGLRGYVEHEAEAAESPQ